MLPAGVALLAIIHVALFRKHGVTPSPKADLTKVDSFHPAQLAKDVFASLFDLGIVFALSWREHGAPLDAPADPSSDYPARPEWYFLGLFQLLKYFKGSQELIGTVVIPQGAAILLGLLPLLGYYPRLRPVAHAVGAIILVALLAGVVALTLLALADDMVYPQSRAVMVRLALWVAAGLVLLGIIPREFIPTADRGGLRAFMRAPEGSTIDYTDRYQRAVEKAVLSYPEVD